jgi:hypothetical protein
VTFGADFAILLSIIASALDIQAGIGNMWHGRCGRGLALRRYEMGGAWYALATIAVALVIRWYIQNDTGTLGRDSDASSKHPKPWRSGRQG